MRLAIRSLASAALAVAALFGQSAIAGPAPSYQVGGSVFNTGSSLPVPGVKVLVLYVAPGQWFPGLKGDTADPAGKWSVDLPIGAQYIAAQLTPGTGKPGCEWIPDDLTAPAGTQSCDGNAVLDKWLDWRGTVHAADTVCLNFYDVCIGPGGGKPLAFWVSTVGQQIITASDLAVINALNLYGGRFAPVGAKPPFTTQAQLAKYLKFTYSADIEYPLSAQMIVAELNLLHGAVSGDIDWNVVYVKPLGDLPGEFYRLDSLVKRADSMLSPATVTSTTLEKWQIEIGLANANAGKHYIQSTNCPVVYGWWWIPDDCDD
ncbi:MAG TPA: hypothetical protein VGM37_00260 [Armatimonadota bacterium]|jgi:hypothetical protein